MRYGKTIHTPRSTQHADRTADSSIGEISPLQLTCILSMFYGPPLAYAPIRIFNVAGHSGWIAGMLAGVFGMLIALLWVVTSLRFRGQSFPEYATATLGPVFGRLAILIVLFYFLSELLFDARIISEVMVRLMPTSPLIVFVTMSLAFAVFVARRGPEVIGRLATFHGAVVACAFVFTCASVIPQVKPDLFLPILERGWLPVFNASITPTSFVGECIIVGMLIRHLSDPASRDPSRDGRSYANARFVKSAVVATVCGTALMWFYAQSLIVLTQGVIGATDASRLGLPSLTLIRGIEIGTFIERIESALVAVWMPAVMLKMCVFLYGAAQLVRHLVGAASFRSIVLALAALTVPASLGSSGPVLELIRLSNGAWSIYALFSQVTPALLVLGVSAVKGASRRGSRA